MSHPASPFAGLPALLQTTAAGVAKHDLVQRAVLALICALIERLCARLGDLFGRWQAGTLP
eukprot:gene59065-80883_t